MDKRKTQTLTHHIYTSVQPTLVQVLALVYILTFASLFAQEQRNSVYFYSS